MFKATTREGILAEVNAPPADGDVNHGFSDWAERVTELETRYDIVFVGERFELREYTEDES